MKPDKSIRIVNGDPYETLVKEHPFMIDRARLELRNAHSYRGFHVAATALAVGADPEVGYFFSASNVKKNPDSNKVCAEKRIIRSAEKAGMTAIVGLVVVGTTDRDKIAEVTPFRSPTLYCCKECVGNLDATHVATDDMLVTTVGDNKDVYEVQSFGSLRRAYATGHHTPSVAIKYKPELWHEREDYYAELVALEAERENGTQRQADLAKLASTALRGLI